MERTRWIVVGTDFSAAADRALQHAAALASELRAAVAFTHAYEDAPGACCHSDLAEGLTARLEEAASRVRARFPAVKVECFVRRGAPWEKLANVACELGADMIVVGASGERGCANRRFVGSVVSRVTVVSDRAVLVVPEEDEGISVSSSA